MTVHETFKFAFDSMTGGTHYMGSEEEYKDLSDEQKDLVKWMDEHELKVSQRRKVNLCKSARARVCLCVCECTFYILGVCAVLAQNCALHLIESVCGYSACVPVCWGGKLFVRSEW